MLKLHDEPTNPAVPVVLHVRVMAGTGGGPEKTILRSPRYVDANRYRIAAAYMHPAGDTGIESIKAEAERLGCELFTLPERGPLDPRCLTRLIALCRKLNVSIWHGHDYKSNLLGLIVRRHHPMKLVTTAHNWLVNTWRMRLYRRIDLWCLRRYDQVICVSRDLYDLCTNELGIPADRLSLVHNAIELKPWSRIRTTAAAKAALGIDPATPVLGFVGRLSYEKAIDRALHAVGAAALHVPNMQFVLIGDGPEHTRLTRQVRDMRLNRVVRFVGWRKPLQPWYEAMDALVLPSRTEGMPNVLLEAMAMGVPVAATAVGGVSDLLDHGRCGVLLGDDVGQWYRPLTRLMTDPSLRRRYADAARRHIESHFTFEHRVAKVTALYDRLLNIDRAGDVTIAATAMSHALAA